MYFSKKRHHYGTKTDMPVSQRGFAIYASKHYPRSVADVTNVSTEIKNQLIISAKRSGKQNTVDVDRNGSGYEHWRIMFAREHIGTYRDVCSIIWKIKPPDILCQH